MPPTLPCFIHTFSPWIATLGVYDSLMPSAAPQKDQPGEDWARQPFQCPSVNASITAGEASRLDVGGVARKSILHLRCEIILPFIFELLEYDGNTPFGSLSQAQPYEWEGRDEMC